MLFYFDSYTYTVLSHHMVNILPFISKASIKGYSYKGFWETCISFCQALLAAALLSVQL